MSRLLPSMAIAAAVAASGLTIGAGGAASAPLSPSVVQQGPAATNVAESENVQWRRGGWRRGGRGIGLGIGAGILGGAVVGSVLAGPRYYYDSPYYYSRSYYYGSEPTYVERAPAYDDPVAYCMSRFRSYDPASGTYLGYDGFRHPCP